ncbi:MAG: site-2 protease family protein [Minisyncoccia bacterium]
MTLESVFIFIIVIFSVIIHEVSHGYSAYFFGDQTAKYQGRLTLNPLKHIDIFGSILLPLLLIITNAGIFLGWAKPVPYNPYNLRNRAVAEPLIAFSGPLSNFLLAFIFAMVARIMIAFNFGSTEFLKVIFIIVFTNIILAVFNLIPIPPLDGSRIITALFPSLKSPFDKIEWAGMFIVLFFVLFFGQYVSVIASHVASFFLGM